MDSLLSSRRGTARGSASGPAGSRCRGPLISPVLPYETSGATALRRLTQGGNNRYPVWSHDGQYVAFQSSRQGDAGMFWQRADGTGAVKRLTRPEDGTIHIPEGWSVGRGSAGLQRRGC